VQTARILLASFLPKPWAILDKLPSPRYGFNELAKLTTKQVLKPALISVAKMLISERLAAQRFVKRIAKS
jgi:hypothetical protein